MKIMSRISFQSIISFFTHDVQAQQLLLIVITSSPRYLHSTDQKSVMWNF